MIVIVGGTTGLGLSAARACLHAGARVVCVGMKPEPAARARDDLGASARVVEGDARDAGTAVRAIAIAQSDFGSFHCLYHVAGGSGRSVGDGPLDQITDEGWSATLRLNLDSLFYSNRAAVRQFLKQESGGAILNMGSVLGFSPAPKYFSTHAYAATKAAVIGFSRSVAASYAAQSIRVNVLAPALVDTPMAHRAMGNDAVLAYVRARQPLDGGRAGRPDDLDGAVVYLLSDAARYVTGQVLAVDGGWSLSGAANV